MQKTTNDPTKELWLARLGSALRTTLACTIVCCTTLYGPESLKHFLTYPAFSYVTTVLIVSDSTLGDTIKGCWLALYATIQVMIPSILILHVVGPSRFDGGLAAFAVAVSAFFVALPESTPLMAKRIAFGQLVIVYVGTVIHGDKTGVVMHPVHVALSTALGALASVLAMLVPYPKLAYYQLLRMQYSFNFFPGNLAETIFGWLTSCIIESTAYMRTACRSYVENTSERLSLFVEAFTSIDNQITTDSITRAKSLVKTGIKHLQTIKKSHVGIVWEKPQPRFLRHNCTEVEQKIGDMELPIRGMEMALSSCSSFPIGTVDKGLREVLSSMKRKICLKLEKAKCFAPSDATIAPDAKGESSDNASWIPNTTPTTPADLPAFFFVYCMELLVGSQRFNCITENTKRSDTDGIGTKCQPQSSLQTIWNRLITVPIKERWTFAFKCSLSLGLAVLFGLMYNKENGYWSGLTIAISFATRRQATFTVANARAQGTAMGSVYGILICFIFQRYANLRFLPLLPWIIFTSFLRHSRMYGQAGGISAVIGALLILGRENYGPPCDFAIARLTEACIGLICFIMVEILLQRARAANLAKNEFAKSLAALQDCMAYISICPGQRSLSTSTPMALREKQKKLRFHVNELEKFIAEAELEPNFWFLPFNVACYRKLLESLLKMADLLLFAAHKIEILSQTPERLGVDQKHLEDINGDLEVMRESLGTSLKHLTKLLQIQSIEALEKEFQKKIRSHDLELGKTPEAGVLKSLTLDQKEMMDIIHSILQHSKQVADKIQDYKGKQKLKGEMIICLSSLGFCINNIMQETSEVEKEVKQLIEWENPSRHINLYELSRKIDAMNTK